MSTKSGMSVPHLDGLLSVLGSYGDVTNVSCVHSRY